MELQNKLTRLLCEELETDNLRVLKCEYPNVELKGGYVAQMVNVIVHIEMDGLKESLDLIVKTSVPDAENIFTDAYLNEIDVYTNILAHFDRFAEERGGEKFANIPKCFGISKNDKHLVIIMENLIAKNYKVRKLSPLNLDHVQIVLGAYAKWHAFSFALNDQKPDIFQKLGKRKTKLEEWVIGEMALTSLEEQIDYVISKYEALEKPEVLSKLRWLRKNYRNLTKEFLMNENDRYLVVTHSDAWNNNLLFQYNEQGEPVDVKIVDWQTAVVGSPLIDIAQIFFFCCQRKELDHMDDLLSFYYKALSEKIRQLGSDPNKCFPFEALLESFKRYAPLGIAGMPFLMRMFFDGADPEKSNADTSDGNFGNILKEDISDFEGFFKAVDDVLELCIQKELI